MSSNELVCQELVELITDYLEGTLAPDVRARFEAHLAGCTGCARYVAQMQETIRVSGTLADEILKPETKETLLHLFRDWQNHPSGGS